LYLAKILDFSAKPFFPCIELNSIQATYNIIIFKCSSLYDFIFKNFVNYWEQSYL